MVTGSPDLQELWPLLPEGSQRLEREVLQRRMTEGEAASIAEFAKNGYVVLPRAVEDELVDELVKDVRAIGSHPGCFVTTDHRNQRPWRLSGEDFDHFESIFDPYVNFRSARRVCLHPVVTRFLELVFETPVVVTQQLLFQRSNQHPIHQDTSVVCMEDPLLMVASWIALEDVVPGRGELTYYEGSHRIPPYPFADGSRRLDAKVDREEDVRRHILFHCERLGYTKRDFIARKGDVLLWAADLAHGSNPRTRPDDETRMSVVTHYAPTKTKPFWFRFHPNHRRLQAAEDGRAEYASLYYELPTGEGVARPDYPVGG